jgi:heme exporter protein A
VLTARDLCKRHGAFWALRSVTIDIVGGTTTMLFGDNGAGKTTLVRLLASAASPTGGSISWFGSADPARARIAMLSHADGHYDDLSALEHLNMAESLLPRVGPGAPPRRSPAQLLDDVGLSARSGSLVRTYSAGMRKRLAFARLLQKNADLILLDEPYSALDPNGALLVDRLLGELHSLGRTVIVSTHQVERTAKHADNAIHLSGGRVIWSGLASDAPARVVAAEPG